MSPEKKVLVVEDDDAIRAFLATLLSHSGYACDFSPDGNDAVHRLRNAEYDAILLDLMLPGQFGFDIIRFLNAERPSMCPRVIVLTAASQATMRDFDASKIHTVLRKPFDIDQLLTHVRTCTSMT
jgi:DNA-binding response OmpR family regulator